MGFGLAVVGAALHLWDWLRTPSVPARLTVGRVVVFAAGVAAANLIVGQVAS